MTTQNQYQEQNQKHRWLDTTKIPRDPPYTGMVRDFVMNLLGATCYYCGREWYYGNVLTIDPNNSNTTTTVYYFNNLYWAAFVPLFSSRFPQQLGLGVDMMIKGWLGGCCALLWLCITISISPTSWSWIVVAIFLDGFCTHLLHVRDRTWLSFNVFHLMLYWGAILTSYFHHIERLTTDTDTATISEDDISRVDWEYVTVLAYSYFVPYSIGTVIAIGCHLVFCPISSTQLLQKTLHQTGHEMATIIRTFRNNTTVTSSVEDDDDDKKEEEEATRRRIIEQTIEALQLGGSKLLQIRTSYRQQVAHAYLETRWKFSNDGYLLEQRAANQARAVMTMNAFCDDVTYRLQRVLKEEALSKETMIQKKNTADFQVPNDIKTLMHKTESFIHEYAETHMDNHVTHMTEQKKETKKASTEKTTRSMNKGLYSNISNNNTATKANDDGDVDDDDDDDDDDDIDEEEAVTLSAPLSLREEGECVIKKINKILRTYTKNHDDEQYFDIASNTTDNNTNNNDDATIFTTGGSMMSSQVKVPIVPLSLMNNVDRLYVTILYSLRNVILSLITNDTLFMNNDGQTGSRNGFCGMVLPSNYMVFEDWRRHDPIGTMNGIFTWSSHTLRSSIQQGMGLVILSIILVYMYGEETGTTPGAFAVNTYCSVLRQVFVGWACCRILVRCGCVDFVTLLIYAVFSCFVVSTIIIDSVTLCLPAKVEIMPYIICFFFDCCYFTQCFYYAEDFS